MDCLFFTHPFSTLRSLSSHSTISNLHIFLSSPSPVPYCQWPVDGSVCKSECWYVLSDVTWFYGLGKSGTSSVPNRILRDTGTDLIPINPGMSRENRDELNPVYRLVHVLLSICTVREDPVSEVTVTGVTFWQQRTPCTVQRRAPRAVLLPNVFSVPLQE